MSREQRRKTQSFIRLSLIILQDLSKQKLALFLILWDAIVSSTMPAALQHHNSNLDERAVVKKLFGFASAIILPLSSEADNCYIPQQLPGVNCNEGDKRSSLLKVLMLMKVSKFLVFSFARFVFKLMPFCDSDSCASSIRELLTLSASIRSFLPHPELQAVYSAHVAQLNGMLDKISTIVVSFRFKIGGPERTVRQIIVWNVLKGSSRLFGVDNSKNSHESMYSHPRLSAGFHIEMMRLVYLHPRLLYNAPCYTVGICLVVFRTIEIASRSAPPSLARMLSAATVCTFNSCQLKSKQLIRALRYLIKVQPGPLESEIALCFVTHIMLRCGLTVLIDAKRHSQALRLRQSLACSILDLMQIDLDQQYSQGKPNRRLHTSI